MLLMICLQVGVATLAGSNPRIVSMFGMTVKPLRVTFTQHYLKVN
jgi:hypothetical protein